MKNLLLSACMLFFVISGYSQLYVSPAASTDSYVYVNDQILFVEQDVNLVANTNDPTTEASIYLRNEGQLIQGSTVDPTGSTNTGTGFISVYQESYGDSFNYTFWNSPVGIPTGSGNTYFQHQRLNDSLSVTNSSPAIITYGYNGTQSPLTVSKRWMHIWDVASQDWVRMYGANNANAGYGFIMKGTGTLDHTQRYDFRGRPNNGDMTLTTQTGVAHRDGIVYNFTLAGNPYPSALNLWRVANDGDNTEIDSFKFWHQDLTTDSHFYADYVTGYATWIPGATENDPGSYTAAAFYYHDSAGNPINPTNPGDCTECDNYASFARLNAPVGQGFMIVANTAGSIVIKNAHRVYKKESVPADLSDFRSTIPSQLNEPSSGSISQIMVDSKPQLRLHTYFGENSHFRDNLLLFNDNATDGYDRLKDATHTVDIPTDAYFTIGGGANGEDKRNLVIQTIPFDNPNKMVPITIKLEEQMNFRVKAVEEINVPYNNVLLYDNELNRYTEIGNGNQAELILPAGVYENRFFITFRGGSTSDDNEINEDARYPTDKNSEMLAELLENVDFYQNNAQQKLFVLNPERYDIKDLYIFDLNGKLILEEHRLGTENRFSFPTHNFSDGVYMVKLTTADDITADYKITVFNK